MPETSNLTPLISLCIPTYNREGYLKTCLDSIVKQFEDRDIYSQVEIVISDNASPDGTTGLVKQYQEKYGNIRYYRNDENIGAERNLVKVADYAEGEYIWFFSDDDIHRENSIKRVIDSIRQDQPGIIFCNFDSFHDTPDNLDTTNRLKTDRDIILESRKEFFSFLSTKFFFSVDWFTTFYSILVVKREIFMKNKGIIEKYSTPLDIFPYGYFYYYTDVECRIKVIADRILLFRSNNLSWGPKKKLNFLLFSDKAFHRLYKNIVTVNRRHISFAFLWRYHVKNLIRKLSIVSYFLGVREFLRQVLRHQL